MPRRQPSAAPGGAARGGRRSPLAGTLAVFLVLLATGGCSSRVRVHGSVAPPGDLPPVQPPSSPSYTVVWIETGEEPASAWKTTSPRRQRLRLGPQEFRPRMVVVPLGTRLRFENRDTLHHVPFSRSTASRFRLAPLEPGRAAEVALDEPGEVRIFCELHSEAFGAVLVLPTREFVVAGEDGQFAMPRLRQGRYTLAYWHPDWGEGRRDIEVPSRGDCNLEIRF